MQVRLPSPTGVFGRLWGPLRGARWLFCLVIVCLGLRTALAAPVTLFDDPHPLAVTLTGPLDTLIDGMEHGKAYPFTLSAEGESFPVMVSARGKSRLEICQFPPLRLTFAEAPPDTSPFRGLARVKLVTHCRDVKNMAMNVREEYAAYRIFSALSPIGFRARLMDIDYRDEDGASSGMQPAFAIEPTSELTKRLGGEEALLPAVYLSRFDAAHLALVSVFHYLVGNTDWSLVSAEGDDECCHNGKLLRLDEQLYLLPYDFDRTGLVNASYAKPAPGTRLRKVTQRRYRGYCTDDLAPLADAIMATLEARDDIEDLLRQLPGLDPRDRNKDLEFIAGYYERAADPEKLLQEFRKNCIG